MIGRIATNHCSYFIHSKQSGLVQTRVAFLSKWKHADVVCNSFYVYILIIYVLYVPSVVVLKYFRLF